MIARYKGCKKVDGQPFDVYHVDDGCEIHKVSVSAWGGMVVESPPAVMVDGDSMVCIIAAVLEQEEKRGF